MNSYRGPDRRRSARPETGSPFDLSFVFALVLIGASFALALRHIVPVDTSGLDGEDYLAFGAASVLALSVLLLVADWRVSGALHVIWAAASCGLVAAVVVMRCVASTDVGEHDVLRSLALAFGLLAIAAGLRAAATPAVGPPVRLRSVLLVVAAAVVAVAGATAAFAALGVGVPDHGVSDDGVGGSIALIGGWVVLTAAWLRRGRRDADWAFVWLGLLSLSLALAELAVVSAVLDDRVVPLGVLSLVFVGTACAARGAARTLQIALDVQARELDETRASMGAAHDQARSARAAAEERAHEAKNALQAVGGAIQTLEKYHEKLDDDVRAKLSDGIARELERLQRLIEVDERTDAPTTFSLETTLAPVVAGARAQGLHLTVAIPEGIAAIGSPMSTAQIVQNLLVNAHRHAGGVDVSLEVVEDADRVRIVVSDGGPGVSPGDREHVFGRTFRTAERPGHGLGLYVSRRLARAQGGDLWVAARPGGGAVFSLDLALSSDGSARVGSGFRWGPGPDDLQQIGDAVDAG